MKSMHIPLKNTENTRSLSTLVNKEGKHIKAHKLIRSDALNHLEQEDMDILVQEYKLKRVIDLRCDNEVASNPDKGIPNCLYYHCPILPNERVGVTRKGNDQEDFESFIKEIHYSGAKSSIEFMKKVYAEIIETDFAIKGYRKFLNYLLEDVDGATLWHCSAGKDRAGFATILILSILDFDRKDIIEDYLNTNAYYQKKIQYFVEEYGKEYEETLKIVFGVHQEYLDVIFNSIEKKYHSLDNYIQNGLGIDQAKKERLKELYLGE